ncbi:hypothetical protein SK803_42755 [Lentzea sp. BCCO 10_0856]|uniref:SseB protein N-terminal domain-containing protein n=1 Tax=Lentzea miocenica TaxID=3095431 RepID=A0ABU4TFN8_9PSEU|nr:hypothetical protein [Lentzea sp. BCCO 10_0856]MDX8036956.1 hypothetical protein [Lentzea sp. BCCO 10_0856]
MTANDALADILDRQASETESEQLLAALVDHGVFVPVQENGTVMFLADDEGAPALPGFVSKECCADRLSEAATALHCDALQLLEIVEHTGVEALMLHSYQGWARVPAALMHQTLQQRGRRAAGEQLQLSASTHRLALALRDAVSRRLPEVPAIRTVWVSQARWLNTGVEHLMLHVAVDEPLPSSSADRLVEVLLAGEVVRGDGDPQLGMLALNTTEHAGTIAELEASGLDSITRS